MAQPSDSEEKVPPLGELVAVRNAEYLRQQFTTGKVGRRSEAQVLLVTSGSEKQLWVDPGYGQYRAAWKDAFGEDSIPNGFAIDHVHNRDRAIKERWAMVRLACIPGNVNSWAAGIHEGKNTGLFYINAGRPYLTINFLQWSKLNTAGKQEIDSLPKRR